MTSIRTLAVDLAPLRFNCIVPGVVDTELLDVSLARVARASTLPLINAVQTLPKEQKELLLQKYSKELPVKHVGRPEEVAEAVSASITLSVAGLLTYVGSVSLRDEMYVLHRPGALRRRRSVVSVEYLNPERQSQPLCSSV
jgi:NAD(P)-dependent dehydrogenase (short-subunit alcohol dehydrogenase family)